MTFPAVTLHNHTTWSDGETSLQEMVEEANRIGLEEIGFSDHYTLRPSAEPVSWSMPLDRLAAYVDDVLAVRREMGPRIRLGIEADFFPETVDELRRRLAAHPFDFVVGSVHFVDDFPIDSRAKDWESLSQDQVDDVWRTYWYRVWNMAASGVFDIAAHLDLPKKFGFQSSADLLADEYAALTAIKRAEMAIEINTNGWNLPCAEAYPTLSLLKQARNLGIPLVISSDAHHPRRLIDGFDRARDLALEAGYSELVRFESRRRTAYPL